MKIKNVLVVCIPPNSKEYKSTLSTVKNSLKKHDIKFNLANRDRLKESELKGKDLIIAVGGDGTFLRAAHFVKNETIMGVNADVKNKEGFYMCSDKNNFESQLRKLMRNKIQIKKLPRLEAYINNKKIECNALNEFFIGQKKSYQSAKYTLKFNGKKERHKSSGILVATATGSYAWAKACHNKTLPLDSSNFQFVVREPYTGNIFRDYKLTYGLLKPNEEIEIESEMLDGIIIADSVGKEFKFRNGDTAKIKLSKNFLSAVWCK